MHTRIQCTGRCVRDLPATGPSLKRACFQAMRWSRLHRQAVSPHNALGALPMIRHALLILILCTAMNSGFATDQALQKPFQCPTALSVSVRSAHSAELAATSGDEAESIWVRAMALQWDRASCGTRSPEDATNALAEDEALALWQRLLDRRDAAPHLLYNAILDPNIALSPPQRRAALHRVLASDPHNAQSWLVSLQAELQSPRPDTDRIDALLTQAGQQSEFSRGWLSMVATWWRALGESPANESHGVDAVDPTLQFVIATSPLADVKTLHAVCAHEAVTPLRRAACRNFAKHLAEGADSVAVQHTAATLWAQLATDATDAMRAAQWRQELDSLQAQFVTLPDTPSTRALINTSWIDVLQNGGREIDVQRQVLRSMSTSGTATPGSD